MKPKYREDKATQVAAKFLELRGGRMHYLKLIKLLYLADREALIRWRRPITYDTYVAMSYGPVVSQTFDVLQGNILLDGIWKKHISPPMGDYEVQIKRAPGTSSLSKAEEELIAEIFDQYGHMNSFKLCDITHNFPEWNDPKGSSTPISYKDILSGADMTDIEVQSIIDEIEQIALMDEHFER